MADTWAVLKTVDVILGPSEEVVGGWKVLKTVDVILYPKGYIPECETDADCPPGYKCVNGECVKEEVEGEFPWQWLVIGGLGVASVILLMPQKEKVINRHLTK